MYHITFRAIEIYHPEKIVENDYYIEHFTQREKDIKHFIEDIMGRKKRYIVDDPNENALTMATKASKRVLETAGLSGEEIDMIVFSTQTPEYTFPTNAILLHHAIQGKHEAICLDSNANCAGMLVAVEQACRYMMSNPHVTRTLVVGSDYNSINCNPEEEVTFANYGDAAAAVILEKTDSQIGFIDSMYYTDSAFNQNILFPACGLSNIYKGRINSQDIQIKWTPFDGTVCVDPAVASMKRIAERNNLDMEDIGAFCFSQFSWKNIELIQTKLNLDPEKVVYVGDEFGYTGTSSPFLALYRGIERGQVKKGDYIFFWSVGAGWQIVTMLFKY